MEHTDFATCASVLCDGCDAIHPEADTVQVTVLGDAVNLCGECDAARIEELAR